ncbi:MAG TPA: hypothetical protein VME42_03850 [Steroidobacteraceae bacterium]|nr:hypothetical protein [Steroidobacteraceae bacterium]
MPQKGLPALLDRHWAESVLAIGAVIIAAVSLWVAYDSEITNRQLVASQSWPYVEVYESDPGTEPRVMRLYIANDGIGPAKLESFELFWKGKPQRNPWELLQACCAQAHEGSAQTGDLVPLQHDIDLETSSDEGIVVRAGQILPFLALTRNAASSAIWDALHSEFEGNLSVRYCYCSVFNECWVNTRRFGSEHDMNPPRVVSCARPKVPYDNKRD